MSNKPTIEQLATVAAMLDGKLSPDDAVKQALQLFEAADRLLRAEEIAEEKEFDELQAEAARLASIGLGSRDEKVSLYEAFNLQQGIANKLGVPAFKTEARFTKAMRDANLTITEPVGSKTFEEWFKSPEPEMPIAATNELTSRKAIEQLFHKKAEQRKAADRNRKQAKDKYVKGESSKNLSWNGKPKKRNKQRKKRKIPGRGGS